MGRETVSATLQLYLWYPFPRDILKPMMDSDLRVFFWDVNQDTFDPHAHPEYTVFRLLELGDERAVAWLREEFSREQIEAVIRKERRLSRRSAGFWALVYRIPREEVAALKS